MRLKGVEFAYVNIAGQVLGKGGVVIVDVGLEGGQVLFLRVVFIAIEVLDRFLQHQRAGRVG